MQNREEKPIQRRGKARKTIIENGLDASYARVVKGFISKGFAKVTACEKPPIRNETIRDDRPKYSRHPKPSES